MITGGGSTLSAWIATAGNTLSAWVAGFRHEALIASAASALSAGISA